MEKIKIISIIILVSFVFMQTQLLAQTPETKQIESAIRSGNSTELAKYFNSNIQLKINSKNNVYSKMQANKIINNFFVQHKPVSYQIKSEKQREDTKVILGNINTGTVTFRIIYRIVPSQGKSLITYMEIEAI